MNLIESEKLNVDNFKAFIKDKTWIRLPRKLNKDNTAFFYTLNYEDDTKIVKIVVKPHKEMSVTESFKNYMLNGEPAPSNYKGQTCDWGFYVNVKVDEEFIKNIDKIAKNKDIPEKQLITW